MPQWMVLFTDHGRMLAATSETEAGANALAVKIAGRGCHIVSVTEL